VGDDNENPAPEPLLNIAYISHYMMVAKLSLEKAALRGALSSAQRLSLRRARRARSPSRPGIELWPGQ
jgi:hypothetical protein